MTCWPLWMTLHIIWIINQYFTVDYRVARVEQTETPEMMKERCKKSMATSLQISFFLLAWLMVACGFVVLRQVTEQQTLDSLTSLIFWENAYNCHTLWFWWWNIAGGAGMAQWWALASQQYGPGLIPNVDAIIFVCCCHPCSEGFSLGSPVFLLHKNQHSQIAIWPGNSGWKSHSVETTEIPICSFNLDLALKTYPLIWTLCDNPGLQIPLLLFTWQCSNFSVCMLWFKFLLFFFWFESFEPVLFLFSFVSDYGNK